MYDNQDQQQSRAFIKPQSEWTREDKLNFLNYEKLFAALGIFFSLVLCTNLFLINSQESNHLTLGFGITSLILCLANIAFMLWALKTTNVVKSSEDQHAEESDSNFSRIILFIAIIMLVTFATFYLIFSFAQSDLINQYEANHQIKQIQAYKDYVASKFGWIEFLSYANIVCLFLTIFCVFALTGSPVSSQLLIYLVGNFLLFAIFYELLALQNFQTTIFTSKFNIEQWTLTVVKAIAITLIIVLFLTFFANMKRLRMAYLILGSFFLACCAIQIPATGQLFREYNNLDKYVRNNCRSELGSIDVAHLENQGCPNKYLYNTKRADCESDNADPSKCFQRPIDDCAKDNIYIAWEKLLVKDYVKNSVLACLNNSCCGVVVNIYSQPLLAIAALSFVSVFLSFILSCLCFNLSAKDMGKSSLNRLIQILLVVVFLIILIVGIFLVCLLESPKLPHRDLIIPKPSVKNALYQTVEVEPDATLSHYPHKKYCENFIDIIRGDKKILEAFKTKLGATPVPTLDTGLLKKADKDPAVLALADNVGTSKIDLNDLFAKKDGSPAFSNEDQCSGNNQCKRPGYIVVLQTPKKTDKCKNANAAPDNLPTDLNGFFYYYQDTKIYNQEDVRLLETEQASYIINPATVTTPDPNYRYIGFVGNQNAIEAILTGPLHVCSYHSSCNAQKDLDATQYKDYFFRVKVLKVDLVKWGFKEVTAATSTTSASHNSLRTLPYTHNKEEINNNGGRILTQEESNLLKIAKKNQHKQTAAPPDFNTVKCTKYYPFEIRVHDFETDQPLEGVTVKAFAYATPTNPQEVYSKFDYNLKCDVGKLEMISESFSDLPQDIQFFSITDNTGIVRPEFCFKDPEANYNQKTAAAALAVSSLVIYVSKPGYADNCRPIVYHANSLEKAKFLDIGLSKLMKEGQARVVLEWTKDLIDLSLWTADPANPTVKKPKFADVIGLDLDLYSSFGANGSGSQKFICNVGHTFEECGGVKHNGDNSKKVMGKSSESVTLSVIGNYEYLFYYNRFVESFSKKIKTADNKDDITTRFNQDIFDSFPVIKYFTADNKFLQAQVTFKQLFPNDPVANFWNNPTAKTLKFDGTSKFFLLGMCIRSGINDKINPNAFNAALNAPVAPATSTFVFQPPAPATPAVAAPIAGSYTPLWSNLMRDEPDPAPAAIQKVNVYNDTISNDFPTVFTPIYRTPTTQDPNYITICNATTEIKEWLYDYSAVNLVAKDPR